MSTKKEMERNAKRRKVKESIDLLKKLMDAMDAKLIKPSQYKMVEVSMNSMTSNDLMCCKKEMLDEILIPINKALSDYKLPKGLSDICEFMAGKIKKYSETRTKQSKSGKKSGKLVKEKHIKINETKSENKAKIEEIETDDFGEIVSMVSEPLIEKYPNMTFITPDGMEMGDDIDEMTILIGNTDKAHIVVIKRLVEDTNTLSIKDVAEKYKDEDTPLGDLCGDILRDREFPNDTNKHFQFKYIKDKLEFNGIYDVYEEFATKCKYNGF